jgi:hypothetical protein
MQIIMINCLSFSLAFVLCVCVFRSRSILWLCLQDKTHLMILLLSSRIYVCEMSHSFQLLIVEELYEGMWDCCR